MTRTSLTKTLKLTWTLKCLKLIWINLLWIKLMIQTRQSLIWMKETSRGTKPSHGSIPTRIEGLYHTIFGMINYRTFTSFNSGATFVNTANCGRDSYCPSAVRVGNLSNVDCDILALKIDPDGLVSREVVG